MPREEDRLVKLLDHLGALEAEAEALASLVLRGGQDAGRTAEEVKARLAHWKDCIHLKLGPLYVREIKSRPMAASERAA